MTPDRPGLGTPEGEESSPTKPSKTWWGELLGKLGSTQALTAAQLRIKAENEARDDVKVVELAKIASRERMLKLAIGAVVSIGILIIAGLVVVYGRDMSSAIISIGGGVTTVETKTQGTP